MSIEEPFSILALQAICDSVSSKTKFELVRISPKAGALDRGPRAPPEPRRCRPRLPARLPHAPTPPRPPALAHRAAAAAPHLTF